MATGARFKPGVSGCPEKQFKPGNSHRWQPGMSGNPAGVPQSRLEFERAFNAALLREGSPEEAAHLLWKAARAGEAWAIQNICQRFAPQTQSLRMIHEVDHEEFDYTKLTDEQLDQLARIMEAARSEPEALESGKSPAKAA